MKYKMLLQAVIVGHERWKGKAWAEPEKGSSAFHSFIFIPLFMMIACCFYSSLYSARHSFCFFSPKTIYDLHVLIDTWSVCICWTWSSYLTYPCWLPGPCRLGAKGPCRGIPGWSRAGWQPVRPPPSGLWADLRRPPLFLQEKRAETHQSTSFIELKEHFSKLTVWARLLPCKQMSPHWWINSTFHWNGKVMILPQGE